VWGNTQVTPSTIVWGNLTTATSLTGSNMSAELAR
jgi:hypothetical protein